MAGLGSGISSTSNINMTQAAESIVLTTPILEVPRSSQLMLVVASLSVLVGASATSCVIRLRRGAALSDTQVMINNGLNLTAGSRQNFAVTCSDVFEGLATVQYSLTWISATETAQSIAINCSIFALAVL